MLRSAPLLRHGALLLRGPFVLASVGPGSAEQRDRTMLRIAGRTLHRVRDTVKPYPSSALTLANTLRNISGVSTPVLVL